MTQQPLNFGARPTLADRVAAYFTAHPNVWINAREFLTVGGFAGWRTRISELRQRGMDIENRCRHAHGVTVSEYCLHLPARHQGEAA